MIYNGHENLLDDIPYTVRYTTAALRPHKTRFDFLVVTGMSGVLIGSPVAIRLDKPLVVVRKEGDNCHAWGDLIGQNSAHGRYVFIDDFIAGGSTYHRVRERMAFMDLDTRYVGSYLYSDKLLSWEGDGLIKYRPKRPKDKVNVKYEDAAEEPAPKGPTLTWTPQGIFSIQEQTASALDAITETIQDQLRLIGVPQTPMWRVAL